MHSQEPQTGPNFLQTAAQLKIIGQHSRTLYYQYKHSYLQFCTFCYRKKYNNLPWFNKHLKRLRNIRQKKWRSYRNSRHIVSSAAYKEAAGRFRTEFMQTKRKFEKDLFQSDDTTGKLYGYVKARPLSEVQYHP